MKSRLISLISSCFISVSVSHAALSFSEIMYDPEGSDSNREWVEVRNDGDTITLASFKLFESNTNHSISISQGGATIPSGGYAIVADDPARFLQDFPSFTGILFDSSFSLSNAGEFLSLKDSSGQVVDSLTYSPGIGGSDDGTTLSLVHGVWVRGDATPGADNEVSSKPFQSSASSTKSQSVTAVSTGPSPDLMVFAPEERLVIAGADALFTASALTSGGSEPSGMTYDWSFGDGGSRSGKSVTYRYTEPGFYMAVIDAGNGTLFAKNRVRVHVVSPTVLVTDVKKSEEKIAISLSNPSPYELDIGSWKIGNNGLYYSLPKNTILLPRATTTLNALEFGMSTSTTLLATTSIYFPAGQLLASSTYIPQNGISQDKEVSAQAEKFSSVFEKKIEKKSKILKTENNTTSDFSSKEIKNISHSTTKKDSKIVNAIRNFFSW